MYFDLDVLVMYTVHDLNRVLTRSDLDPLYVAEGHLKRKLDTLSYVRS